MTVVPQYRICQRCGRRYSWNPAAGRMSCPYCNGKIRPEGTLKKILSVLLRKKNKIDYR